MQNVNGSFLYCPYMRQHAHDVSTRSSDLFSNCILDEFPILRSLWILSDNDSVKIEYT